MFINLKKSFKKYFLNKGDKEKVSSFLLTSNYLCGGFENKRILEVGSGVGSLIRNMSKNFQPKEAIGIDPTSSPTIISDNCRIEKSDIRNSSFESGYFDVIISNFAFEHILNLDVALSEMYRLLKKGGYLYAQWGPIWSAPHGHHLWYTSPKNLKTYNYYNVILPPFCHLLMQPDELLVILKEKFKFTEETNSGIIDFIYNSNDQNRLFYEDYEKIINESKFKILFLKGNSSERLVNMYQNKIQPNVFEQLNFKYPDHKNFMHNGMITLLRK